MLRDSGEKLSIVVEPSVNDQNVSNVQTPSKVTSPNYGLAPKSIFAGFSFENIPKKVGNDHDSLDVESLLRPYDDSSDKGSLRRHHTCKEDCTTELHEAAKRRNSDKIKVLLDSGADPNGKDCQGRIPLHHAVKGDCSCECCIANALKCLRLLVTCPRSNINIQDNNGDTALHMAADNQSTKCASLLIYSGADVSIKSRQGVRALKLLVEKVPEAMECLLNKAISIEKYDAWNVKCELKVDFGAIVGYDSNRNASWKTFQPEPDPNATKYRKETQLLNVILDANSSSRKKILTHPLVAVFLYLKWRCVRPFFWTMTFIHTLLLLLYTMYILDVYLISCPYRPKIIEPSPVPVQPINLTAADLNETSGVAVEYIPFSWFSFSPHLNREELRLGIGECHLEIGPTVKSLLLLGLTVLLTLFEIFRMLPGPRSYFKSTSNRFQWIYFLFIYLTAWPAFMATPTIAFWQYQAAAFGLFIAWAIMLFQIGKFPKLGLYVEILTQVLKNFGFFMITYMCLVMAFALAFCVLFPGNAPYASIPLSILKVFMMMVGEVNYEELFYGSEDASVDDVLHPVTGHILYGAFVIMITVVLMNLLVGLTVSDIQGLQRNAEVMRLSCQIREVSQVESFVMSKRVQSLLPCGIGSFLRESMCVVPSTIEGDSHSFHIRPNDPEDKRLPEPLKFALLRIAGFMQRSGDNVCKSKYNNEGEEATTPPPPPTVPAISPVKEEFPTGWSQSAAQRQMELKFGGGRGGVDMNMMTMSPMIGIEKMKYVMFKMEDRMIERMKSQVDGLFHRIEEKLAEVK